MAKRRKSVNPSMSTDDSAVVPPLSADCCMTLIDRPHQVEREVRRELLSQPDLRFSSLVVRRVGRGVFCLEGVLEATSKIPDVCTLAQRVAGVERVLNHLVVRTPRAVVDARSN